MYAAMNCSASITSRWSPPGMPSRCIAPSPRPERATSNSASSAASAAASPSPRRSETRRRAPDQLHLAQAVARRAACTPPRHRYSSRPAAGAARRPSPESRAAAAPPRRPARPARANAGDLLGALLALLRGSVPPAAWKASIACRCSRAISIGCSLWRCITQAPSHSTSTGHTREQLAPSTFASRIASAEPRRLPRAILLDESRHVDVRRTRRRARRVKTVQAAIRFHTRGLRREREGAGPETSPQWPGPAASCVPQGFTRSPYISGRRSRKNCHVFRTSAILSRSRSAVSTSPQCPPQNPKTPKPQNPKYLKS